jgi:hypothetical protein
MEFIKFIKRILSRLRLWYQPRPNALESSFIGKLPPEIILYIREFLPHASAAAFSLCCTSLCSILGADAFAAIKDGDELETMREYLALLERDLPNHLACFYCSKLHSIKEARSYRRSSNYRCRWNGTGPPQCWEADLHLGTFSYIHWDFSYIVFQMAMKRYRQGLDFTGLLRLLCKRVVTQTQREYTHQTSAQARIVAGRLLVRTQEIFVYSAQQMWLTFAPQFTICPHYVYDLGKNGVRRGYGQWFHGGGAMKCECCLTEFRLDVKDYGEIGIATYCTRWQNLGEGKSPLDQIWQRHVAG